MNDDALRETADRLRATSDPKEKSEIAGLVHSPVEEDGIEKECGNCVHFQLHRERCDVPELDVAVKSDWYCVLWRA